MTTASGQYPDSVDSKAVGTAGVYEDDIRTGTSVAAQLSTWHPHRGESSVARAIVPSFTFNKGVDETTGEPLSKNPFKLLRGMSPMGWLLFFSGWWAWTCDGYDYFAVSVTMKELGKQFGKTTNQISLAITLTLLFRSLGAIIFGLLADRYGRKWTLVVNMVLICAFELGSGFCNTYTQFLGVRACFGIVMGGIWGTSAATALENAPAHMRGLLSGILQQGYAVGYLLAAVINLTVGQYSAPRWRSLYFIGAGFSLSAAILRAFLPESQQFLLAKEQAKAEGVSSKEAARAFGREIKQMLKTNWIRCIWAICLMTGFNFFSHGSQDLYPTYLETTKGLTTSQASRITIISNVGAIVGGTLAGYVSQYMGRRLAIVIACVWTACWIPLWILPKSFAGLAAGGFFLQSGVQGAWGVVPIYLTETSPPAFRASFAGLAYQIGNMASAGSAQIEATAGKTLTLKGTDIPDYAAIMGILIGCVIAWLFVCTFLGPDADGAHFEQAKVAFQSGAGEGATANFVHQAEKGEHTHHELPREGKKEDVATIA